MSLGIENEYGTIGKDAIDQVDKLLLNNRLLQLIVAALLIALLILTFGYFSLSSERTSHIMMPPYGEFEVAKMRADPLYYRVWGDYVLARIADFNPSTIKDKLLKSSEVFERNTYLSKKADFDNYYAAVLTNNLTQEFTYNDNEVIVELSDGGSSAMITYNGTATQSISNITKITKKCFYKFGFYISDFKIYQDSVSTDCLNNDSVHRMTKEEKVIDENDPNAVARKAQQEQTDKDIDSKVIKRENLDDSVKSKEEFEKAQMQKRKEKLIDESFILKDVMDAPRGQQEPKAKGAEDKNKQETKQEADTNKGNQPQNAPAQQNGSTQPQPAQPAQGTTQQNSEAK